MTETIIRFSDGSEVVTTDQVDLIMIKKLMDERTQVQCRLVAPSQTLVSQTIKTISGVEQKFTKP